MRHLYSLTFTLPAIGPFRLDLTVWALKRRCRNIVDRWEETRYIRVLIIEDASIKVEILQKQGEDKIVVVAKSYEPLSHLQPKIVHTLNLTLGLQVDLAHFYALAKNNKALNALVSKFKGVKPPRFPTLFETLTNAIAFQQLSMESGFSLLTKLTLKYGRIFEEKGESFYSFPEPDAIAKCSTAELRTLGFSRHKSEALLLIASIMANKDKYLSEEFLQRLPNEELILLLSSLKGFGRWSAEYALLRGLGRIEIIPGDDVAAHKSLKVLFKLRKELDFERIKKIESEWHPFAGMIYFHLLLKKIFDNNESST
jgi:DNA-3-methyladenine glycosylase II